VANLEQLWRRRGADDELLGHADDVAAGHRGRDPAPERDVVGQVDTQLQHLGGVSPLEVLVDVAQHVGVAGGGREHVDEPEQLRLERRVRHRPAEHPLAPPRHGVDAVVARTGPGAQLGDVAGEGRHLGVQRRGHRRAG
jgi:hypothetical protein